MRRKIAQKIKGKLVRISLESNEVILNHLFHPEIYPDLNIEFSTVNGVPFVLNLEKPKSVLEIDKFLIRLPDSGSTEQEITSRNGYFQSYTLPDYPVGEYVIQWGFKDVLGHEIWRADKLIVRDDG